MPKQASSQNLLMDLRLVILRTIADVWADDNYTGGAEGWERLRKLKIIDQEQLKKLERHLTFNQTLRITLGGRDGKDKVAGFDPDELKRYLKIVFGYRMPLPHFGTYFIPGTAQWNLLGFESWQKPVGETITLLLPKSSGRKNENQKAIELMSYYSKFPTFFGLTGKQRKHPQPVPPGGEVRGEYVQVDEQFNLAGNDYDLGVAQDDFFSFGAVVNQLVAKAWNDPAFLKKIDYRSPDNRKDPDKYFASMLLVLETGFQFKVPWAFDIRFTFIDDFWIKMKSNRVVNTASLEIPINPKVSSDNDNFSMALAKYNTIGPAYPFTCS